MARENKMMLVYIEHRFYGSSVPNNDSSNRNLRFLTTDQALHGISLSFSAIFII